MKFIYFSAILMVGVLILMGGCTHEHSDDTHTHDDESHAPTEAEPLSYTLWTQKSELFVEFPALIVGETSRFASHFTEMENFKAVEEGKVEVFLLANNNKEPGEEVTEPSSPGIFRPSITPQRIGAYTLQFILTTQAFSDTIIIPGIDVYPDVEAAIAANPPQPEGDAISFLKEQAWKIDFAIQQVKKQSIHEVIHTSGEIQPVKGEEKIVSAKSSGIVFFRNRNLQEGREIRSGESLFVISSAGLLTSNLEEKFKVANARIEKTKADFERAEDLLKDQIIGQKEYERRKMENAIAEAEFQTLTKSYNKGGQGVIAPMTGIIKNVMVSDGQFVEEGAPLVEITRNRRLLLQAEVSQRYLPKLRFLSSANFKTPYQETVQSIKDYNGKLVSYGKITEDDSRFVPVLFELDNLHQLIPGSFVELFLLTSPINNQLVVPKSALMQDYSVNYVYVQSGGESFEKREVKLGIDDGFHIQVLSGIAEGEWVVTEGAYQIKMASMSSTIPAHGHEH